MPSSFDNRDGPSCPNCPIRVECLRSPGWEILARWGIRPLWLLALAMIPVVYSVWALVVVARAGEIGVHCVLGVEIKEAVSRDYEWTPDRPKEGDKLLRIGSRAIVHYPGYVEAKRLIRDRIGETVEVEWLSKGDDIVHKATATIRRTPFRAYRWSLVWFAQEMVIFIVAARVYWRRPKDEAARLFFWLCIVTVGAYMGGYHWTEIVIEPVLIYLFALFAVFVPVVSLHFYLVFPRVNAFFERHRRAILGALYGVPLAFIGVLWSCMYATSRLRVAGDPGADASLATLLRVVKGLALGYIGLSVVVFGLCIVCLSASYRSAVHRAERNQTYWILVASQLAILPIGYLLWSAWWEPARLGLSSAAWPMYVVSLLYSTAYALSITRYKLMQVEEIYNRSRLYVLVSLGAGLLYSGVLVGTTLLIEDQLLTNQTSGGQVVAGVMAIALLVLFDATRARFQKAIDRRFYREKYKFDQAMQKMNLAVGQLVDRGDTGAAAPGGGGGHPPAGVGGHLPGRDPERAAQAGRLARARARRAGALARQPAGRAAPGRLDGPGPASPVDRAGVGPGHGHHDRPGAARSPRPWRPTARRSA